MRKREVKVGMCVVIVDKPRDFEDDCGFISPMERFLGKRTRVIGEKRGLGGGKFFALEIDSGKYYWDARWFNKCE